MKTKYAFYIFLLFTGTTLYSPSLHSQAGNLLSYNNPGLIVDLGVGLWANPIPADWDGDGDTDLLVTTTNKPSNGTYYFENLGNNLFAPGQRIAEGMSKLSVSWPDGHLTVCTPETVYPDFKNTLFSSPKKIGYKQEFYSGRTKQWKYADFDGDGVNDLIIGVSDWREYGWDDAYNDLGEWTHGPLHGYVYWVRNKGTDSKPDWGKAIKITAGGKTVDVYGKPSPNLVDWDRDGDMDLICGEFLDRITFFENTGSRTRPEYAVGRFLEVNGHTLHLELEMPEVVVFDWDKDGDDDIIVGMEDGRVVYIENSGPGNDGKPVLAEPVYFRQQADKVKCGALATPTVIDWDGDGDQDIISGNTAGFIEFIENLGGKDQPSWAAPQRMKAGDRVFRVMAGKNMSIQGPAEAKWGYTVPYATDWNMDGLTDIVFNDITGRIKWLPNIGTISNPRLGEVQPVLVDWEGNTPKPSWNWWDPAPNDLVVQWRTRPVVLDLNEDGLNDLIAIDHEGYLSYFERKKTNGKLLLKPGKRIFLNKQGDPLRLNERDGGHSGRRKIALTDWDHDGDYDLLVNTENIALYRNTGNNEHFIFTYIGNLTPFRLAGHSTCPAVVDWNKDGIPDLLIGAEDGFFYYFPRQTWNDLQTPQKIDK